jgi:hypothetical protein
MVLVKPHSTNCCNEQDKNNFQFHKISPVNFWTERGRETARPRERLEFLGADVQNSFENHLARNGAKHTTGVSGEISDEPDAVPRKNRRGVLGGENGSRGKFYKSSGSGPNPNHRHRNWGQKLILRAELCGRRQRRLHWNGRCFAAGHLAATTAVMRLRRHRNWSGCGHGLRKDEQQAAKDGQRNLHKRFIAPENKFCRTLFAVCSTLIGWLIGRADFDDELVRRLVEIFFTIFAAQLHFLSFVSKNIRPAHITAEFFAGHGTAREQIRLRLRVGRLIGVRTQREVGGKKNSGNDGDGFHNGIRPQTRTKRSTRK